jgi:outer membrane beta-barrel protein
MVMGKDFKTLMTTTLLALFVGQVTAATSFAQQKADVNANSAAAGSNNGDDLNIIEMELDKTAPAPPPQLVPGAQNQKMDAAEDRAELQNNKLTDFSGLGKLAPFSEISVLQKRYLPKTDRIQFTAGLGTITNNPWFFTAGVSFKVAYFFTEAWGLEGTYNSMTSSQRTSAQELHDNNGVSADSFGFPKNYMGLDVKYSPFYGKMTWLNQKIVPFEHYFTVGAGNTSISTGGSGPTLHLGTGQNFAISKRFSVNWDFSMMNYAAKDVGGTNQSFSDLLLTVGFSFFYPEASYR